MQKTDIFQFRHLLHFYFGLKPKFGDYHDNRNVLSGGNLSIQLENIKKITWHPCFKVKQTPKRTDKENTMAVVTAAKMHRNGRRDVH